MQDNKEKQKPITTDGEPQEVDYSTLDVAEPEYREVDYSTLSVPGEPEKKKEEPVVGLSESVKEPLQLVTPEEIEKKISPVSSTIQPIKQPVQSELLQDEESLKKYFEIDNNFKTLSQNTGIPVNTLMNAAEILKVKPPEEVLPTGYGGSILNGIYESVGSIAYALSGGHQLVQKALDLPITPGYFGDIANVYKSDKEKYFSNIPNDVMSRLLQAAGSIIPDVALAEVAVPELGSYYLAKLTKNTIKTIPKFATYLGAKETFKKFAETQDVIESIKGGLEGFKTGLYYQALGIAANEIGGVASKLAANEKLGAYLETLAQSLLFGSSSMVESGKYDVSTFLQGAGLGLGFGAAKLKSAIESSAERKMLMSYFTSSPEMEKEAMESKKTNTELRREAIDLRLKAKASQSDMERTQYLTAAAKLENYIGIRGTIDFVKQSPEVMIEAIQNDKSLSPNEADYYSKKIMETYMNNNKNLKEVKPEIDEINKLGLRIGEIDKMEISDAKKEVLRKEPEAKIKELQAIIDSKIKIGEQPPAPTEQEGMKKVEPVAGKVEEIKPRERFTEAKEAEFEHTFDLRDQKIMLTDKVEKLNNILDQQKGIEEFKLTEIEEGLPGKKKTTKLNSIDEINNLIDQSKARLDIIDNELKRREGEEVIEEGPMRIGRKSYTDKEAFLSDLQKMRNFENIPGGIDVPPDMYKEVNEVLAIKKYDIGITTATEGLGEIGKQLDEAQVLFNEGKFEEANKIYTGILDQGHKKLSDLFKDIPDIEIRLAQTKGTFFSKTEPTFDYQIIDKGNNIDIIKERLVNTSEEWNQKNVHVSIRMNTLPEGMEVGKELEDGSVHEIDYDINFGEQLSDQQYKDLLTKINDLKLPGANLKNDKKTLNLYNISKFENYEQYEAKFKQLYEYLKENRLGAKVKQGYRKLWVYGRAEGGATRSYEEVRSEVRGRKAKEPIKEPEIKTEYIPLDKQKEIVEKFTHYKSGDKLYPRTTWANWFLSRDRKSKERIADEIEKNPELKNALLSSWYDEYVKESGEKISFEDFLNKDIEVYRGETEGDVKGGEPFGFQTYAPTEQEAKNFSTTGNIIKNKVKPKDTFGLIQTVGAEREILIPTKRSPQFYEKEFNNKIEKNLDVLNDEQKTKLAEFQDNNDYENGLNYLNKIIGEPKNAISTGKETQGLGKEEGGEARIGEVQPYGVGNVAENQQLETRGKPEEVSTEKPIIVKEGINLFGLTVDDNAVYRFLKEQLTAKGYLPKSVFNEWVATQGRIKAELYKANYLVADLRRAMREVYGKTILGTPKISKEERERLNGVLQDMGEGKRLEALQDIPEPLHEPLLAIRDHVDALSRELIRSGITEGKVKAVITMEEGVKKIKYKTVTALKKEIIENNLGYYLTRTYRAHNDKQWKWENIPEDIKNRAISWMRAEYPDYTDAQINTLLKEWIYQKDGILGFIQKGKLGSKDLGITMRRKGIPVQLRDLLGEYKDPMYNYSTSVSKMANLLEKQKFLEFVKKDGMGKYLFTFDTLPDSEHYVPIAAKESKVMEPLNGIYTTPEIARAFETFGKSNPMAPFWRAYMKYLNVPVKYGKTVLSPVTHSRNYFANYWFHIANGRYFFMKEIPKAHATMWNDLTKKDSKEFRDYMQKLVKYNVIGESTRAGEVHDAIADATIYTEEFDKYGDSLFKKAGRTTLKGAEKLYQMEDDVHKIIAFEYERKRYESVIKKQNPGKSEEEINDLLDKKAAEITRKTMATNSLVPKLIRNLRRFPLVGTFVSFPAEVIRTYANTLQLAVEEMKDPDTRDIGITRLSGLLAASAATATISTASRYLTGVDKQDEVDMKRFVPPWSKNSDLMITKNKGDGIYAYVDMGFSDPYNYIKKPINALLKGEDWQDAALQSMKELAQPFLGEELVASKLIDIARNTKKDSKTPIYNPEAPYGDQLQQKWEYLWAGIQPGVIYQGKRIARSFSEKADEYGLSPENEFMNLFLGMRSNNLDVNRAFGFKVYKGGTRLNDAQNIYRKVLYDKLSNDKEKQKALEAANKAVENVIMDLNEDYRACIRLGVDRKELFKKLDNMNIEKLPAGRKVRTYIMEGKFRGLDERTGKIK